jgi:hypothetical protein
MCLSIDDIKKKVINNEYENLVRRAKSYFKLNSIERARDIIQSGLLKFFRVYETGYSRYNNFIVRSDNESDIYHDFKNYLFSIVLQDSIEEAKIDGEFVSFLISDETITGDDEYIGEQDRYFKILSQKFSHDDVDDILDIEFVTEKINKIITSNFGESIQPILKRFVSIILQKQKKRPGPKTSLKTFFKNDYIRFNTMVKDRFARLICEEFGISA